MFLALFLFSPFYPFLISEGCVLPGEPVPPSPFVSRGGQGPRGPIRPAMAGSFPPLPSIPLEKNSAGATAVEILRGGPLKPDGSEKDANLPRRLHYSGAMVESNRAGERVRFTDPSRRKRRKFIPWQASGISFERALAETASFRRFDRPRCACYPVPALSLPSSSLDPSS